jgi:hypothetical protein
MSALVTCTCDQAFQVNPQWPQVVGLRPANSASNPTGNRKMLTTIVHVGKPARSVKVLHLEQEIADI